MLVLVKHLVVVYLRQYTALFHAKLGDLEPNIHR